VASAESGENFTNNMSRSTTKKNSPFYVLKRKIKIQNKYFCPCYFDKENTNLKKCLLGIFTSRIILNHSNKIYFFDSKKTTVNNYLIKSASL